jgi:uncharacterized protein (TIGR03118 family)
MFAPWSRTRRKPPTRLALRFRPRVEALEARTLLSAGYLASNLVSDQPGVAPITDSNLVNAWGIGLGPTGGAFWVSDNGTGKTTLYSGDVNGSPFKESTGLPNGVSTVSPDPTGQVFNPFGGTKPSEFVVSDGNGDSGPAFFIFASESGIISGWNPAVPPPPPSTTAQAAFTATDGAVFKGIAIGTDSAGADLLYATDFHNGKIDVFNSSFQPTTVSGSFSDPNIPAGFAPFGIADLGGKIYVTYAKQNAAKHDDVAGPGNGFVDLYNTDGVLQKRLVTQGALNSPWGLAIAPANFGKFSNALIVGDFGDGKLHAYNPTTGKPIGTNNALDDGHGNPLVIDGLWGLTFGNGKTAGDKNALYFASGPDGESHGLFGKIMVANNLTGMVRTGRHIADFSISSLAGLVSVTNTSSAAISGPITIELTAPPSSVTLVNSAGTMPSGDVFITLHVSSVAPGQSVEVPVLLQGSLMDMADYFEGLQVTVFTGPFSSST